MKKNLFSLCAMLILGSLSFSGCAQKKGTMEKAGESIDDAFDNDGPAEKAGESLDNAGN